MPETCTALIQKAFIYLNTSTATWPTDHLQARVRHPETRRLSRCIDTAALAGDYQATAHACRALWRRILSTPPVIPTKETV
jgi:hypothetical protein